MISVPVSPNVSAGHNSNSRRATDHIMYHRQNQKAPRLTRHLHAFVSYLYLSILGQEQFTATTSVLRRTQSRFLNVDLSRKTWCVSGLALISISHFFHCPQPHYTSCVFFDAVCACMCVVKCTRKGHGHTLLLAIAAAADLREMGGAANAGMGTQIWNEILYVPVEKDDRDFVGVEIKWYVWMSARKVLRLFEIVPDTLVFSSTLVE